MTLKQLVVKCLNYDYLEFENMLSLTLDDQF